MNIDIWNEKIKNLRKLLFNEPNKRCPRTTRKINPPFATSIELFIIVLIVPFPLFPKQINKQDNC